MSRRVAKKVKDKFMSVGVYIPPNPPKGREEIEEREIIDYIEGLYRGQWSIDSDLPHGYGTFLQPDGLLYQGCFLNGSYDGDGRIISKNGDVYEGQWVQGLSEGRGIMESDGGNIYVGEWKQNQRHGTGTQTYSYGEVYEGEWEFGKKHGKGSKRLPDGWSFEGTWKEGKLEGNGKFMSSLGNEMHGEWKKDKIISFQEKRKGEEDMHYERYMSVEEPWEATNMKKLPKSI
jgi:1-phosphatidylinositol-4-phosphate 5-kinase